MSISLAPCSTAISISLRRVSSGVWPCKRRSQSCRYRAKHLPHPAASIHSTLCFFREDLFYIHGLTMTRINTEANLKLFSVWLQLATVATHMRTHTGETMFAWIKCDYNLEQLRRCYWVLLDIYDDTLKGERPYTCQRYMKRVSCKTFEILRV